MIEIKRGAYVAVEIPVQSNGPRLGLAGRSGQAGECRKCCIVEAELAGLRLLLSRGVADDPLLPSAAYRRLSLAAGPTAWADAAIALLDEPAPSTERALAELAASPMNMDRAHDALCRLHQ